MFVTSAVPCYLTLGSFVHFILGFLTGLRQKLDDVGLGQAYWLLCGLPPFLRVKEMRAKSRGELMLNCNLDCAMSHKACSCLLWLLCLAMLRKAKLVEAMTRFKARVGCNRFDEVMEDYSNLDS